MAHIGRKVLLAFDVLLRSASGVRRLRAVRLAPAAGLASSPEISVRYPREGREIPHLVVNKLGVLDSGPSSRRVSETSLYTHQTTSSHVGGATRLLDTDLYGYR